MTERFTPGARKTPEIEKKFSAHLRSALTLFKDEAISVIIESNEEADDELLEAVSETLINDSVHRVMEGLLAATVSPPDIRQKLTEIATNNQVISIALDEPLMPITIPVSYFR